VRPITGKEVSVKRTATMLALALAVGITVLSIPGGAAGGDGYFPLKEGKTWTYQVSAETRFGGGQLKLTVANLAPRDLKGKRVVPQHARGEQGQSELKFLVGDAEGIAEVATQGSQDIEPKLKNPPEYVIKFPVKPGNQWEVKGETSALSEKISLPLRCAIESTSDAVTITAGNFTGCLKIKCLGETTKTVGVGIMATKANIRVEEHRWYGPGVGLIRLLRIEESNHLMLGGGKGTIELLSHK
jgi:hypothetical protein